MNHIQQLNCQFNILICVCLNSQQVHSKCVGSFQINYIPNVYLLFYHLNISAWHSQRERTIRTIQFARKKLLLVKILCALLEMLLCSLKSVCKTLLVIVLLWVIAMLLFYFSVRPTLHDTYITVFNTIPSRNEGDKNDTYLRAILPITYLSYMCAYRSFTLP